MNRLLLILCFSCSFARISAQSVTFEGTLIYGRKFYTNPKRIDSNEPNLPPTISFKVKAGMSLAEIITEKDTMTAMNYSVIKDAEKKEATMLAHLANKKMAVKFDPSYFDPSKLYKIISPSEEKSKVISGLNCKLGYAIIQSEFGSMDSMKVWYTLAYRAIPYQFETYSSPGLIVSIQQDELSFWELTEIKKHTVPSETFSIPSEYVSMTQNEMQEYISTLEQLNIEDDEDWLKARGNEINREEEED